MEELNLRSLIFWLSIVFAVGLVLFVPRGCTSTEGRGAGSPTGTLSIDIAAEKSILTSKTGLEEKLKERYLGDLFSERHTKRDWFFLVDHQYEVEANLSAAGLSDLPEAEPILVSITLPGNITSTNADRKGEDVVSWALALGKDYKMKVASRHIRWWLIAVLTLLLIVSLGTRLLMFKRRS